MQCVEAAAGISMQKDAIQVRRPRSKRQILPPLGICVEHTPFLHSFRVSVILINLNRQRERSCPLGNLLLERVDLIDFTAGDLGLEVF